MVSAKRRGAPPRASVSLAVVSSLASLLLFLFSPNAVHFVNGEGSSYSSAETVVSKQDPNDPSVCVIVYTHPEKKAQLVTQGAADSQSGTVSCVQDTSCFGKDFKSSIGMLNGIAWKCTPSNGFEFVSCPLVQVDTTSSSTSVATFYFKIDTATKLKTRKLLCEQSSSSELLIETKSKPWRDFLFDWLPLTLVVTIVLVGFITPCLVRCSKLKRRGVGKRKKSTTKDKAKKQESKSKSSKHRVLKGKTSTKAKRSRRLDDSLDDNLPYSAYNGAKDPYLYDYDEDYEHVDKEYNDLRRSSGRILKGQSR